MLSIFSRKKSLKRSKGGVTNEEEQSVYFTNVFSEEIPEVPSSLIAYLLEKGGVKTEGIFRVPGALSQVLQIQKLNQLKREINYDDYSIHSIAGALKLWIKNMSVPLLTFELHDSWISAAKIKDEEGKVEAIRRVTNSLPPAHRSLLKRILHLLVHISENSLITKMTSYNLAMVFTPSFLRGEEERDKMKMLDDQTCGNVIIQMMIDRFSDIFYVPKNRSRVSNFRSSKSIEERLFINNFKKSSVLLAKALLLEQYKLLGLDYTSPPPSPPSSPPNHHDHDRDHEKKNNNDMKSGGDDDEKDEKKK